VQDGTRPTPGYFAAPFVDRLTGLSDEVGDLLDIGDVEPVKAGDLRDGAQAFDGLLHILFGAASAKPCLVDERRRPDAA
jgi:hypothetical protein